MGQNQAANQLYDVVAATEALKESQTGLAETVDKIATSRGLLALSRITSGILPGFWSFQNKIRAVFDLAKIYYDSVNKETEDLIKNLKAVQQLGAQYEAMPLEIFDEDFFENANALGQLPSTYDAIGKKIKGFSAIEESILGHSEGAQDDDEMNEVLREIKTLLSPQHEALQKRKELIKRRREFRKELNEEYKKFGVKDEQIFRKFLIRKKKQISDTLKKLPETVERLGKMAWVFLKGFVMFILIATLVGAVIRNAWPALKTWGKLILDLLKGVWEVFKIALDGLWMIVEGIFEGDLLKAGYGIAKFLGGLILTAFMLLVTVFVASFGLLGAMIGGPVVAFLKSIKENGLATKKTLSKFLIMVGQIALVIGLIGAAIAFVVSGAWMLWLGIAIAGAIASTIGRWFGKKSIGGPASGMTLVGEQGPELVRLPTGSRVYSNAQTRSMGGNTIHVHVNGRVGASDAEIRDIADKVARHINLRMNRTGTTGTGF